MWNERDLRIAKIVTVVLLITIAFLIGFGFDRNGDHPQPTTTSKSGVISLEPFVVNLADKGGYRFLRISIRLVADSAKEAENIQKNEVTMVQVRSAILNLLTQQTADVLVTPNGKFDLANAIMDRMNGLGLITNTKVTNVLFSDFVVQF